MEDAHPFSKIRLFIVAVAPRLEPSFGAGHLIPQHRCLSMEHVAIIKLYFVYSGLTSGLWGVGGGCAAGHVLAVPPAALGALDPHGVLDPIEAPRGW